MKTIRESDLPPRGDLLDGGIFVTRYWLGDKERALILLPDEFEGVWGAHGQEVATNHSNGEQNTRAMAEAGSDIALRAIEAGGHIPSCLEGHQLIVAKGEGLITLREDRAYWMSTQYSADLAYYVDFEYGWQDYTGKCLERLVRLVRSLIICR